MNGQFWLVQNRRDIDNVLTFFRKSLEDWNYERPVAWKLEAYSTSRSLNQNALFHMWCGQMSKHFSEKVHVSPEDMKKLMKNEFLGTEDVVVGSTTIPNQLRSTKSLSKGEMHQFMEQVFHWGIDHGVTLTNPQDSEFQRARNAQG
jgi:hypothetical protein